MSCQLDPREVLQHLNHLGYQNIDAYQLKEFMKDLKNLMKYEQQSNDSQDEPDYRQNNILNQSEIFDYLYRTDTVASLNRKKATTPKQDNCHVITVELNRKCQQHPSKSHPKVPLIDLNSESNICSSRTAPESQATGVALSCQLPSTAVTTTTTTSKKNKTKSSCKSSFIRPKLLPKPMKSDPVALYHKYKKEWGKIKFPGEDKQYETRWAVRQKMSRE